MAASLGMDKLIDNLPPRLLFLSSDVDKMSRFSSPAIPGKYKKKSDHLVNVDKMSRFSSLAIPGKYKKKK